MPDGPGRSPIIGIASSFEKEELRLRYDYVQAVERSGAVPLVVPVVQEQSTVEAIVRLLDGLIIPGGPAVTLGMLGEPPRDLEDADPLRLRSDVALVQTFLRTNRPVLGICYGMQLLNALDGGTIYADVERQKSGSLVHSAVRGAQPHRVDLEPGSWLARCLGKTAIEVNSRHIQAIADVGASFRVVGRAPDGVIEAIERVDGRVLGVQFHPERMDEMLPVFWHFVAATAGDSKK